MLPPRLSRTATPRWLSRMMQSLTTTSWICPPTSQPRTMPEERDRSVHPEMITFSQSLVIPSLRGTAFSEMQSSPVEMSQPMMRTLDERSMSIPSLLGIRRSPSMRRPLMRASSQPRSLSVQNAELDIVKPLRRTWRQLFSTTSKGRLLTQV